MCSGAPQLADCLPWRYYLKMACQSLEILTDVSESILPIGVMIDIVLREFSTNHLTCFEERSVRTIGSS